VNVIVVGAGVIGASIAEALARRGATVSVLDMRGPGRGASQASAGLLTPFIEGRVSPALLNLCVRGLTFWDEFMTRVRDVSGSDVHYARTGTLEIALSRAEAERLMNLRASLVDLGVESDWITEGDVARFEPAVSTSARAGLFIPNQGFVAVRPLVKALTQAARIQGAQFESPVEVVRIRSHHDRVEVHADDRVMNADMVVVAAGTWSGRVRIADAPAIPVYPMRGQLLELKWSAGELPKRPVWGTRSYTVPWQPDTLLVGATLENAGFDERSTVAGVHDLLAGVGELLPSAWQASLSEVRVGLRPATADHLPLIGPLGGLARVIVATGHFRNGVLLAPLTAEIVSRLVLDGERDATLDVTRPDRVQIPVSTAAD
jgi:glycine oxidase